MESIPIEDMKKVFETNFFGVIRMIKEVMPDMKKRRGGHIIVVSSVMGLQGQQRATSEGRDGGVGERAWRGRRRRKADVSKKESDAGHLNLKRVRLFAGVVFNDVYAASKFAVEGFCESLAVQLFKFNVT